MSLMYTSTTYSFSGKRRKNRPTRAKRKVTPYTSRSLASFVSPLVEAQLQQNKQYRSKDISGLRNLDHMKKIESTKYTGNELLGIATMHKSNAVPVSKSDDAKIFATMRRN